MNDNDQLSPTTRNKEKHHRMPLAALRLLEPVVPPKLWSIPDNILLVQSDVHVSLHRLFGCRLPWRMPNTLMCLSELLDSHKISVGDMLPVFQTRYSRSKRASAYHQHGGLFYEVEKDPDYLRLSFYWHAVFGQRSVWVLKLRKFFADLEKVFGANADIHSMIKQLENKWNPEGVFSTPQSFSKEFDLINFQRYASPRAKKLTRRILKLAC